MLSRYNRSILSDRRQELTEQMMAETMVVSRMSSQLADFPGDTENQRKLNRAKKELTYLDKELTEIELKLA